MISQKMIDAINEQINKELFSEYLYLSMAAYLEGEGLSGFSNFMKVQVQEERFHAMKFYNYVNEQGGRVILEQIDKPQTDWESPLKVFQDALEHEKKVTASIYNLMDIALKLNDHASKGMLQWFVDEQVEEEASMDKYVNMLSMIGNEANGLFMLDTKLAARVFTPPVQK